MAGGIPIMRVYRPAPPPATAPSVPEADTESRRPDWSHEIREWSGIRAQAFERFQQCMIEAENDPDKARHLAMLRRHREAQAQAQAERDRQVAEQAMREQEVQGQAQAESEREVAERNTLLGEQEVQEQAQAEPDREVAERSIRQQETQERARAEPDREVAEQPTLLGRQEADDTARAEAERKTAQQTESLDLYTTIWCHSLSCLILASISFLVILIKAPRCSKGVQLDSKMTCDVAPNLTEGSFFSIMFWFAVAYGLVSMSGAVIAVVNTARLSERLRKADAANWKRVYKYTKIGSLAGVAVAAIPLAWEITLMVRGKCEGSFCLNLGLATPAIMSWTLLAFILGALFLEGVFRAVAGRWKMVADMLRSKRPRREVEGYRGIELSG